MKKIFILINLVITLLLIILYIYTNINKEIYWEGMVNYYPTDEEYLNVKKIDVEKDKSNDEILYNDAKSIIQDAINNKNISEISHAIKISQNVYNNITISYDNKDDIHKSYDEFYSYYVLENDNKAVIAYILTDKKRTKQEEEQYYLINYKTIPHDKLYLTKINGMWEIVSYCVKA